MEATYRYAGSSSVNNNSRQTQMSFAPDTLRQPTFFVGEKLQVFKSFQHKIVSFLSD